MIDPVRKAVGDALLKVARNVAKHCINRDGWYEADKCFQIDPQSAEEEIMRLLNAPAIHYPRVDPMPPGTKDNL